MSKHVVGCDVGTMNLVAAKFSRKKEIGISTLRNMFLTIKDQEVENLDIFGYEYIEDKDENGKVGGHHVLGEEAFKLSQIFNVPIRRPMKDGVISSGDIDSVEILTVMIKKLVGKVDEGLCVYSIPAQCVDADMHPFSYHASVFGKIFSSLGFKGQPLNEAMAVLFAECEEQQFSGIAFSFGCGLTNVACAYKGTPVISFSVKRGGDWIDECVAQSTATGVSRVTSLKEKKLSLVNINKDIKKKERRVLESLNHYYKELIEYVLKVFVEEFRKRSDCLDIEEEIPIIISGGTSMPDGFEETFKEIFGEQEEFPYEISEIRRSDNPLGAVASGCLIYALWKDKREAANQGRVAKEVEATVPKKGK